MAEAKSLKKSAHKSATGANSKPSRGFSKEERAAMRERAKELKSSGGESAVLAAIAKMPEPDRTMAGRLHALIKAIAPELSPKTWYGMPAYAKDDKVVCFFQGASKFKTRYATFGFNDKARLDDGAMWPTAFALTKLTPVEEERIGALVKQATS